TVFSVHVPRATHWDGASSGQRACPYQRRLANDQRADGGRGGGRTQRRGPPAPRLGGNRLPRRRARPLRGDRDHVHAVLVLDHRRHRGRVHRLRPRPHLPGAVEPGAPAHVGRGHRLRDLLRDPDHAAGVQLDLEKVAAGARCSTRSGSRPRSHQPASGPSDARANAACHDAASTTDANAIGTPTPIRESVDCWNPIAAPLLALPASSAAAVSDRPFHAIEIVPATTITATTTMRLLLATSAVSKSPPALASPIHRSGRSRLLSRSESRPAAIRENTAPT